MRENRSGSCQGQKKTSSTIPVRQSRIPVQVYTNAGAFLNRKRAVPPEVTRSVQGWILHCAAPSSSVTSCLNPERDPAHALTAPFTALA